MIETPIMPADRCNTATGSVGFTMVAEHMPASYRVHRQWTPAKLVGWGERISAATAGVVRWQLEHRPHSETRRLMSDGAGVRRYHRDPLELQELRAAASCESRCARAGVATLIAWPTSSPPSKDRRGCRA